MRKSVIETGAMAAERLAAPETAAQHATLDESALRGFNSRPSPQRRSDVQIHG
jgi:hypothetical protein